MKCPVVQQTGALHDQVGVDEGHVERVFEINVGIHLMVHPRGAAQLEQNQSGHRGHLLSSYFKEMHLSET